MKAFLFLLLLVSVVSAGSEGHITYTNTTMNQALNSIADLYTMKLFIISHDSADSITNVVVNTKWPGYILKGFYNATFNDSIHVKCRTQQLDTCIIRIPKGTMLWKLPVMDMIMRTGTSDSVYYLFQRQ
jgi:hypothetical protein